MSKYLLNGETSANISPAVIWESLCQIHQCSTPQSDAVWDEGPVLHDCSNDFSLFFGTSLFFFFTILLWLCFFC